MPSNASDFATEPREKEGVPHVELFMFSDAFDSSFEFIIGKMPMPSRTTGAFAVTARSLFEAEVLALLPGHRLDWLTAGRAGELRVRAGNLCCSRCWLSCS